MQEQQHDTATTSLARESRTRDAACEFRRASGRSAHISSLGLASEDPAIRDAELVTEVDQATAHPPGSSALTERPSEATREVSVF